MKEKKKIRINIHPVEDHPGDYLAYFRSEFLDATYTVFFKDTTMYPRDLLAQCRRVRTGTRPL